MEYSAITKYKGLIFDLDGTLINSMSFHAAAWRQVANEHGFDIDEADIYKMGGSSSYDIARHYKNKGLPVGDVESYVQRKIAIYKENLDKIVTFPKIVQVLKDAKERGVKVAVGTGSRTVNATRVLTMKGLIDYVDVLVTADDVTRHKPNPDIFLLAAQKLGLDVKECCVFEDGALGVKAAVNGAFDCIEVKDNQMINYFEIER